MTVTGQGAASLKDCKENMKMHMRVVHMGGYYGGWYDGFGATGVTGVHP